MCRYFLPLGQYPYFLSVVEQAEVLGRYICWFGDVDARQHCLLHDASRPGPCVVRARLIFIVILRDVIWPCAGGAVFSLVFRTRQFAIRHHLPLRNNHPLLEWPAPLEWARLVGQVVRFPPLYWYHSTGTRVSTVLVPLLFCFCSFRF